MKIQRGFTLIEVLLAIVLISLLTAISIEAYYSLFYRNDLDVAKNQVAQALGRAASLSAASFRDSNWGVEISTNNVVIFKGITYAGRDQNYDEIYPIASSITPSGLSEVIFTKMTGLPQSTGTVTLTSANGDARNITINSKGTVSY
jgi:prepilin-type N-terminal cleavage/methylation domain-containing protein